MRDASEFQRIPPSHLAIPAYLPNREYESPLSELKDQILAFRILLRPLIVRANNDQFFVLDGRRRLKSIWELGDEGHDKLFRWIPCYIVESRSQLEDMRIFLALNSGDRYTSGEIDRIMLLIEQQESSRT